MSISSEITRLESAKSDIITAITNKGVNVPVGIKMDGVSVFIDTIETGENLDTVLSQQDSIITAQDTLIASIQTALQGKAAGGGSSSSGGTWSEPIACTCIDNGMFEPGTNEYKLSNSNLQLLSRHGIAVIYDDTNVCLLAFRSSLDDDFTVLQGSTNLIYSQIGGSSISDDGIVLFGSLASWETEVFSMIVI